MDIYSIILIAVMVVAILFREVLIHKQIKKYRVTISTLLYIISEDPEMYEKVMNDFNGEEEVD